MASRDQIWEEKRRAFAERNAGGNWQTEDQSSNHNDNGEYEQMVTQEMAKIEKEFAEKALLEKEQKEKEFLLSSRSQMPIQTGRSQYGDDNSNNMMNSNSNNLPLGTGRSGIPATGRTGYTAASARDDPNSCFLNQIGNGHNDNYRRRNSSRGLNNLHADVDEGIMEKQKILSERQEYAKLLDQQVTEKKRLEKLRRSYSQKKLEQDNNMHNIQDAEGAGSVYSSLHTRALKSYDFSGGVHDNYASRRNSAALGKEEYARLLSEQVAQKKLLDRQSDISALKQQIGIMEPQTTNHQMSQHLTQSQQQIASSQSLVNKGKDVLLPGYYAESQPSARSNNGKPNYHRRGSSGSTSYDLDGGNDEESRARKYAYAQALKQQMVADDEKRNREKYDRRGYVNRGERGTMERKVYSDNPITGELRGAHLLAGAYRR